MKIITAKDVLTAYGPKLLKDAFEALKVDLARWHEFEKCPRHAMHHPIGVFELMPCRDAQYYAYKYVNCHPENPKQDKSSIVATGMFVEVETGYPLIFCDMTILTAIRTAVTSAIAAKYLAKPNATKVGIIGNGAQAEFQLTALKTLFDIDTVKYFDVDPKAMDKLHANCHDKFNMIPCKNAKEACQDVDILTTAINAKNRIKLVEYDWIKDNDHLFMNAIGGDCPGKTELDPEILKNSRIVIEFYPQTKHEGEIQNLDYKPEYTELWELVTNKKPGRTKDDKIIVFDSVGFALADYSIMKVVYEEGLGSDLQVLPTMLDPKNLFGATQ